MTRPGPRGVVGATLLPAVLLLGGCASLADPGAAPTPLSPSPHPSEPTTIEGWAERAGVAPELVVVTDIEGFELAGQSVGVMGDDGMSAVYLSSDGGDATVLLVTAREVPVTAVPCDELVDAPDPDGAGVKCVVEHGDAQVLLEGDGVDAATLRAAAEAVRVPRPEELRDVFQEYRTPRPPVERGDLPPGDGAPLNPTGPGG